jgi:hypothetical protein
MTCNKTGKKRMVLCEMQRPDTPCDHHLRLEKVPEQIEN